MPDKILKSPGVTPTERLLADYCDTSFLRLWSYANPYRDDGHELCDVLAVFQNHVFIFFDRDAALELPEDEATFKVAWNRWRRNVVDKQVRSAHGAERYIKSGRGVFLDAKKSMPFPLRISPADAVYHKVVVAHGATAACKDYSADNIYGSLGVWYCQPEVAPTEVPFIVSIDRANPVHLLDGHNLGIVLQELDTCFDLTSYLDAKLEAIAKYEALSYCGEEDLLAHYFHNFDRAKKRHYIGTKEDVTHVHIGEGEWSDFVQLPEYRAKKEADEISYFWDDIIQRTCQNYLDGTLLGNSNLLKGESAIHEMAEEPRFVRRAFVQKIRQAVEDFPDQPGIVRHVCFMPSYYANQGYVFLQVKAPEELREQSDYREKRQLMLEIACGAAKNCMPELTQVVGIGIDAAKFVTTNSEDFVLMRCSLWTEAQRQHYDELNESFRFFRTNNMRKYRQSVTEFPAASSPCKMGRNEVCHCGSGRKFKKCCGRTV